MVVRPGAKVPSLRASKAREFPANSKLTIHILSKGSIITINYRPQSSPLPPVQSTEEHIMAKGDRQKLHWRATQTGREPLKQLNRPRRTVTIADRLVSSL